MVENVTMKPSGTPLSNITTAGTLRPLPRLLPSVATIFAMVNTAVSLSVMVTVAVSVMMTMVVGACRLPSDSVSVSGPSANSSLVMSTLNVWVSLSVVPAKARVSETAV